MEKGPINSLNKSFYSTILSMNGTINVSTIINEELSTINPNFYLT